MRDSETRGARLRRLLFGLYSAHFSYFQNDGLYLTNTVTGERDSSILGDFYICPLCLHPFHKSFLEMPEDQCPLSIEDIPPRSVSRRLHRSRVLTCKTCNNTAGTSLESDLARLLQLKDFARSDGRDPLRCSLSAEGVSLGANWAIRNRREMHIGIADKATSSRDKATFFAALREKAPSGFRFTVAAPLAEPQRTKAAILKSACDGCSSQWLGIPIDLKNPV